MRRRRWRGRVVRLVLPVRFVTTTRTTTIPTCAALSVSLRGLRARGKNDGHHRLGDLLHRFIDCRDVSDSSRLRGNFRRRCENRHFAGGVVDVDLHDNFLAVRDECLRRIH